VGIFSHLSNTSAADDRAAIERFSDGLALAASHGLAPQLRHIAASHAAIALPESRFGCVRLGIAIYGLSPFADRTSADLGLRPAMTLRAAVAAVRRVPAGQGVSYGYGYRTTQATTLALDPRGYADGVPRAASGRRRPHRRGGLPVAGRIAMDQFVVDVGDHPVAVGDEAVLFGDPTLGAPPVEVGGCRGHHQLRDRHPHRSARAAARGRGVSSPLRAAHPARGNPRPVRGVAAGGEKTKR
jgi:alanine racemase